MATFTFHTDAGHGWLEVTTRQLKEVGLTPGDFSAYSYQRRDVLYLEEDVDASVFLRTWEAHKGPVRFVERHSNHDHWIRRLDRVVPRAIDDDILF